MRTVRITFGYDGAGFHGSQSQPRVRTVQTELQRAIDQVAPGSGRCVLAGRTDRGVHAVGQVASVPVVWARHVAAFAVALNAVTPDDIVVREASWAADGFNARRDALWRDYRYRIVVAPSPPVLDARYVWWRRSTFDDDAAAAAAAAFLGEHSFGSFVSHGWSASRSPDELRRVVRRCEWRRADCWDVAGHRTDIEVRVSANGFMPRMVRNMVSAMVAVGSGSRPVGWIRQLLEEGDRRALGEAAPAHGLTLWSVEYATDDGATSPPALGEGE